MTVFVAREHLLGVARALRDDPSLRFEMCAGVCGVHYPHEALLVKQALDKVITNVGPRELLMLGIGFFGVAMLKMAATSMTIGSGGSGGIFGPTLVIGAMLGAANVASPTQGFSL